MKTTLELPDELMIEAKTIAARRKSHYGLSLKLHFAGKFNIKRSQTVQNPI